MAAIGPVQAPPREPWRPVVGEHLVPRETHPSVDGSPRRAGVRYRSKFFHDGRKARRPNLTHLGHRLCIAAFRDKVDLGAAR